MIFINETKLFIECNNSIAVYARKLIKFSSSPNQFEIPRRLKIQISTALSMIQTIYTATGIETEKLNESHAYFHSFSYPFRTDKESSSNKDEREEKNFKRGRVLKIFEMGNTAACCFTHGVAKVGSEWFSLRLLNSPRGEFDFLPWESISPLRNETTSCSFSHSPTLPQYRPTDFSYSPFSPLPIYAISRCRPGNPVNLLREEESLRSPRLHQDWFLIFGRRIIFERGIWIFLFNDQFFRNFLFMNVYENNNVKTSGVSWL